MPATASLPQTLTPYHAKYYAYELTRRCPPDSDDRLASALVDAQVDLNPHQIDAALFSFKSPLSRGVLLADEVGLGKTIEAGLVLAQRWAERKRRILVVTPSNLRKQWHQELTDKFFLPCCILEAKSYNDAIKAGQFRPFEADGHIVICSYHFARNKAADVHNTAWDLVVMDEAHRLRNVYKPSNVIANTLKQALASAPKLLLTATPLQNSLLELFGLVSIIDDQVFGDLKSFREQFSDLTQEQVFATLKRRLAPLCHRTLRRQVTAYVSYTRRLPLVEQFTPDESEDRLYGLVSEYLRRDNLKALPSGQRTLMTLVMRKLLASSSFAIAGALDTLVNRLKATLAKQTPSEPLIDQLDEDYEALDETAEEWEDEDPGPPLSAEDRESLAREIADLEQFRDLATSITHNAKGDALLKALHVAFDKAAELGGAKKAIIFTESRKTQLYLQRLLADGPWKDGLVFFKSTALMRLALEVSNSGVPVLWIDRDSTVSPGNVRKRLNEFDGPLLMAIDDADTFGYHLTVLLRDVVPPSERLLVAFAVRSGKVDHLLQPLAKAKEVAIAEHVIPNLTDADIDGLISVLDRNNRLGILKGASDSQRRRAFSEKAGRQLLVAMIEATSGELFEEKAVHELNELEGLQQFLYAAISVATTHRHYLTKDEAILACSGLAGDPIDAVSRLVARHLVVANPPDYQHKARHRVIAEVVSEQLRKQGQLAPVLKGLVTAIASKVELAGDRRGRLWRFLIRLVNHDYLYSAVGINDARLIYEGIESLLADDYHYWLQRGSLEVEHGDLRRAELFLNQSRSLARDDYRVDTEYAYLLLRKAIDSPLDSKSVRWMDEGTQLLEGVIATRGEQDSYCFHVLGAQGLSWARRGPHSPEEKRRLLTYYMNVVEQRLKKHPLQRDLVQLHADIKQDYLETVVRRQ